MYKSSERQAVSEKINKVILNLYVSYAIYVIDMK